MKTLSRKACEKAKSVKTRKRGKKGKKRDLLEEFHGDDWPPTQEQIASHVESHSPLMKSVQRKMKTIHQTKIGSVKVDWARNAQKNFRPTYSIRIKCFIVGSDTKHSVRDYSVKQMAKSIS